VKGLWASGRRGWRPFNAPFASTTQAAAYLESAHRPGLPLATVDEKLKATASAAGIAVYQL